MVTNDDIFLCECCSLNEMNIPAFLNRASVIGIRLDGEVILDIGSGRHKVQGRMSITLFPGESAVYKFQASF